jgi:hypothetical protein
LTIKVENPRTLSPRNESNEDQSNGRQGELCIGEWLDHVSLYGGSSKRVRFCSVFSMKKTNCDTNLGFNVIKTLMPNDTNELKCSTLGGKKIQLSSQAFCLYFCAHVDRSTQVENSSNHRYRGKSKLHREHHA